MYEIQSKSTLTGLTLTVQFPEEDLDRKALYTIQTDQPEFLIPFIYRVVDGMAECTYQIGNRTKLQYRYGIRTPGEYEIFWKQLLIPVLECQDWFLNPFSFAMDPQYLFIDRNERISYVYIPSKRECSDTDMLRRMVTELVQKNAVTDPNLENKVLKSIMQGFNPGEFLSMLRENTGKAVQNPAPPPRQNVQEVSPPAENPAPQNVQKPVEEPVYEEVKPQKHTSQNQILGDDIVIDLKGQKKEKPPKKGLFGGKKAKEEAVKPPKAEKPAKPEKKGGFFGKKKDKKAEGEILLGAAAEAPAFVPRSQPQIPIQKAPVTPETAPVWQSDWDENEVTYIEQKNKGAFLRLIGDYSLPRQISVEIGEGQSFTIGRFDISVGHRQSDFEFDKKTKAVSRHHAVIEKNREGYTILDLSSSAGTFVDGTRLNANVPCPLRSGCRISFGTAGADYIWEE